MGTPHSTLQLILDASPVVQAVMIILLLASLISWMFIIQRYFFFSSRETNYRRFYKAFWSGGDLNKLYKFGSNPKKHSSAYTGAESIFRAGFSEFTRLRKQNQASPRAIMDGAQRAMRVVFSHEEKGLEKRLNFLATVGSTAPYIGLFGTVWGIMNSFQGIAQQQQASLATVAPGISEALIATAMGLFAAIPAVIAYNRFATKAEDLAASYDTFADELSSILHRQAYAQEATAFEDVDQLGRR